MNKRLLVGGVLWCLFFASAGLTSADTEYLVSGSFAFPTNGTVFRTPQPLAPYKAYRIQISSPYDLSPLQYVRLKKIAGIWMPFAEAYDRVSSGILFDGEPAEIAARGEVARDSLGEHISAFTFLVHGKGEPLRLRTVTDFSSAIRSARITIALDQEESESTFSHWLLLGLLALAAGVFLLRRTPATPKTERISQPSKAVHATTTATFPQRNPNSTGEKPMRKQAHPSSVDDLPHDERPSNSDTENLPSVGAPQRNLTRYEQEKPQGFLVSLFDPYARLQDVHDLKRFHTELETQTKIHQVAADTALARAGINKSAALQDHQHKADQWRKATGLKNQADALFAQYADFTAMIERIPELGMPEDMERQFIEHLHQLYFGKKNGDDHDES